MKFAIGTLLLGFVAAASLFSAAPARAIEVVTVFPGDSVAEIVQAAEPGTRFVLQEGIYRGQSIAPRDGDQFIGMPGSVLRGSIVLEEFTVEEETWVAAIEPFTPFLHGACVEGTETCRYANELFVDGERLQLVLDPELVDGEHWQLDPDAGTVRLGLDPANHLVEYSQLGDAFHGDASDVLIAGLIVEQYASPAQQGAIHGDDGLRWSVRDNEVRFNHGTGIRIGNEMSMTGNFVHSNGQLGVGGVGDDVVVANNELAANNLAGFDAGWEGGGSKFARTRDLVVRDNYVHHNLGTGLWTDIDNIGTLYERNLVEWNESIGIRHEISYSAIIRGNIARNNGLGFDVWLWGAQIAVQNSSDVEVIDNFVTVPAEGGDGIAVLNQTRGSGVLGPWRSVRVTVTGNRVNYLGSAGQSGVGDVSTDAFACTEAAANRFDGNHYTAEAGETHWSWCGNDTWESFRAQGQEPGGSVMAAMGTVTPDGGSTPWGGLVLALVGGAGVLVVVGTAYGARLRRYFAAEG